MRRFGALILISWVLLGSAPLLADDFPDRPLTMLIGFTPGGSTDIQGQVLAEVMAEQLGQPVHVQHFPGQGGGSAAAMLADSREQGYLFQYGLSLPFVLTPLTAETSYDWTSFRYVAGVTLHQSALVTGADTPFDDWGEMIEYARQNGSLSYATQTEQDRLIMADIARQEGFELSIVPTSGGATMAPRVISGEVALGYSGGTHSAHTASGDMRLLAALPRERLSAYPGTPTLRELGYDNDLHAFRVLAVPADTPDHHVERLAEAALAATADPRFRRVTEEITLMPVVFKSAAELTTLFAGQVEEQQRALQE